MGTTVAIFHFLYLPVLVIMLYNLVKTSVNSVKRIRVKKLLISSLIG